MSLEFQHHIHRTYNIEKNKRAFESFERYNVEAAPKPITKKNTPISFAVKYSFTLPPQLTDEYRKRHDLSLNDYHKIFKSMPANYLWMMAMYHGLEVTSSAIQSSSSATAAAPVAKSNTGTELPSIASTIKYSGNTQFKSKLEKFLSENIKLSSEDRLTSKRDKSRPQLPVHFVSEENLKNFPNPNVEKPYYAHLYKWKDIYLLPHSYYNGFLKMIRVMPRHVYEKIYGKPMNVLSRPFEYLVDGLVYSGTTEYVLFQTKEGHNTLNNSTASKDKEIENSLYTGIRKTMLKKKKKVAKSK